MTEPVSPDLSPLTSPLTAGPVTRTDGRTNEELPQPTSTSETSVPRARVRRDGQVEGNGGATRQPRGIPEPARSAVLTALDAAVHRAPNKPAPERHGKVPVTAKPPFTDEELAAARAELEATKPEAS